MSDHRPPKPRGFAAMSPELQREIARKGGASVSPENRAFYKNRALATQAGAIGGHAGLGVSRNRKPEQPE